MSHAYVADLVALEELWRVLQVTGGDRERAAAHVAARQLGAISTAQLQGLGNGRGAITHRLKHGQLHRLFRGIYLLGHPVPPPGAREVGALLLCGPHAALSHRSAAALLGFAPPDPDAVHVTVTTDGPRTRPGLRVHRTTSLPSRDRRRHRGLALTSAARTLLDLAADGDPGLEQAVAEAQVQRLISQRELHLAVDRAAGRPGTPALAALVRTDEQGFTRSQAERLVRGLCRQARLPEPRCNVRVCGYEVDLLWPGQRLIVEVDGHSAHGHRAAFERDRRKQMELVAAGYRVIRVTWRQLRGEPLAVIAAVARALGGAQ
ncbi:MAG: DUF559 domain-containing protein [Actinomycetota bacterium]|nr:DUF559 domain-containing protein [Actinomycetota bacterium]